MAFLGSGVSDKIDEKMSDEALLALSVRAPRYFDEIVRRYESSFLTRARRIVGERDEIYDIVQDTFTKIYLNAHRFERREGANFRSWAYKILLNTALTYYARLKQDSERFVKVDDDVLAVLNTQDVDYDKISFEKEIMYVLSRMPRQLSSVLRKYFFEGKKHKEISREEGISVGAVKTRMYRAKKSFLRILKKEKKALLGLREYDYRFHEK